MTSKRLTTLEIKNAKEGMHADGDGLYLRVQPGGAKSWIFRFQLRGKRREMGIGTLDVKGAQVARAEAAALSVQVKTGIDPIDARKNREQQEKIDATSTSITFDEAAKQYIQDNKAGWKNVKHADQWSNTLTRYASPVFGKRHVSEIDLNMVLEVLKPIWETKTETATRVRGRIESILDWATVHGYRSGSNPARWKGNLEHLMKSRMDMAGAGNKKAKVRHHPALPYTQMKAFIGALRALPGSGARALEFGILTATRSGEVRGALWSEIDIDEKKWVIPANRMKAKRDHSIPLSEPALALLADIDRSEKIDLVFVGERGSKLSERGKKPISDMTVAAVIRRMNKHGAKWIDPKSSATVVPHGFRSTFRDWAAEKTSFANQVVEMALAHTVENKVEAAYRRGDMFEKRRELMDEWATYIDPSSVVSPA
jgi:integrase